MTYKNIPGTLALIDGDVLTYRIGFTTEDESEGIALIRMNNYIDEILHNSQASDYQVFLSPAKREQNFRFQLYPEYKANRTVPKPKHYQALRDYLVTFEQAHISENMEADDELGLRQTDSTIICSIDKDLLQIPGRHYNFVKNQHIVVSPEEGRRRFYTQLLMGDITDNIPGIPRVGIKTAEGIIKDCSTVEEYEKAVLWAYKDYYIYCAPEEILDRIKLVGQLVWIRRQGEEFKFG